MGANFEDSVQFIYELQVNHIQLLSLCITDQYRAF